MKSSLIKLFAKKSYSHVLVVLFCIMIVLSLPLFNPNTLPWLLQPAFGDEFLVRVNQQVFVPGDVLTLYGKGAPNDVLVARLFDATGRAVRIESIPTDDDGFFSKRVIEWPSPSATLPFGTYTIQINSSEGDPNPQTIEIIYAGGSTDQIDDTATPVVHSLVVKLDSPTDVSTEEAFRIFVQVTIDGALVSEDPAVLLARSHIHSGEITISLSDKFKVLHEGIYYADVDLEKEGSYIIHAMAFDDGLLSHDSKVISASATTLVSLGEGLQSLNNEVTQTRETLNRTVTEAQESIRTDVEDVEQASGQINSLILPVLALISVILALQISLFARIRASYR
jgi:hypothetical protein